ncbi:Aldehyde Dehydrogenase [Reticulomyxa filosa]|uniref:Aldehyde Dehydrogenase n=1 Tax=Reticulomyxa filosa TaxID=46433 RepID=X6N8W6_RETFI|nr:Aldehyde Dehydrogenase [Reticulomyxa filosa]|eukprot:ETO21742.1 Aldehyde Dehydrogenase [Reticulomyxa filosa]
MKKRQQQQTRKKKKKIVASCRKAFSDGTTLSAEFRKKQLRQLHELVSKHEKELVKAVQDHMNRPYYEVSNTEISHVLSEIAHLHNNVDKYMQPKKVASSLVFLTDHGEVSFKNITLLTFLYIT